MADEEPERQCISCQGWRLFFNHNGVLICEDCGCQQQVQREETEAFEVGGTGVTRREAAGANAGSKRDPSVIQTLLNQISHEDVIAKMKIQARIYAACMQKLLQDQCEVLTTRLGAIPEVAHVVRHLWFSILPLTGHLDFDPNKRGMLHTLTKEQGAANQGRLRASMAAKKKRGRPPKNPPAQPPAAAAVDDAAQPGLARDVNEDEDENEGGMGTLEDGADAQQTLAQLLAEEVPPETQPEHLQTQQGGGGGGIGEGDGEGDAEEEEGRVRRKRQDAIARMEKQVYATSLLLTRDLPVHTSLVLCATACILLKQPITPHDLVRWAMDGVLPYYDAFARCAPVLQDEDPKLAEPVLLLLKNASLSGTLRVLAGIDHVAYALDLTLPNLNGPMLLAKAAVDLGIPQEVLLVALEMYRLYCHDSVLMSPSFANANHSPYLMLMAVMAEVIRLCYGLDGALNGARRLPAVPPPPPPPQPLLPPAPKGPSTADRMRAALAPAYTHGLPKEAVSAARTAATYLADEEAPVEASVAAQAASGWRAWSAARLKELSNMSSWPLGIDEALQLRGAELVAYLQFLQNTLAHPRDQLPTALREACAALPTVDTLVRALDQIHLEQQQQRASDSDMVHLTDDVRSNHGARGSQHPSGHAQQQLLLQQPSSGGGGPNSGNEDQPVPGGPMPTWPPGTTRGRYMPYNYPPLVERHRLSSEPYHPDLMAVVCVCAAYVDVRPHSLIRSMAFLEKAMHGVEGQIHGKPKAAPGAQDDGAQGAAGPSKKRGRKFDQEAWHREVQLEQEQQLAADEARKAAAAQAREQQAAAAAAAPAADAAAAGPEAQGGDEVIILDHEDQQEEEDRSREEGVQDGSAERGGSGANAPGAASKSSSGDTSSSSSSDSSSSESSSSSSSSSSGSDSSSSSSSGSSSSSDSGTSDSAGSKPAS